jgi:hypothetical protein
MTERSEERRELFWKQLQRARGDVQAWPDYVKQALIKPTDPSPSSVQTVIQTEHVSSPPAS